MTDPLPGDAVPISVPAVPRPLVEPPARGTVLVVAPHPDDEAIGPGATVALHRKLGDPVHALFVTSGVHGDADGQHDPAEYVALRQREARAAAEVLDLASTEFWGYPDNMVVTEGDLAAAAERLAEVMARLAPDVLYAPHKAEVHSDHHVTGLMVERAVELCARPPAVYAYEVWSPCQAALVVDVGAVYETKLEAIRCYASQTGLNDICAAVEGLNCYRSVLLPPGGRRAEAFEEWRPPA